MNLRIYLIPCNFNHTNVDLASIQHPPPFAARLALGQPVRWAPNQAPEFPAAEIDTAASQTFGGSSALRS